MGRYVKSDFWARYQELKKAKIEELTTESDQQRNQLFSSSAGAAVFRIFTVCCQPAGCVVQSVSAVPETQKNSRAMVQA